MTSCNSRFGQVIKYRQIPRKIKLGNLGSNHAMYGFNYSGLTYPTFNFALGPQYLYNDLQTLVAYAHKFADNGIVLITLPPPIFCANGRHYHDDKYYLTLPASMIPNYSHLRRLKTVVHTYLSYAKAFCGRTAFAQKHRERMNTQQACDKSAIRRRDGWMRDFGLKDTTSDKFPKEIIEQFIKTRQIASDIIDLCLDEKLRPVFVIPPVSDALVKLLGPKWMKNALYDNINKMNIKNIPVLDYWGDEQFADYSLYSNSDFLTETGSRLFTKRVIEDLQSLNYLPPSV